MDTLPHYQDEWIERSSTASALMSRALTRIKSALSLIYQGLDQFWTCLCTFQDSILQFMQSGSARLFCSSKFLGHNDWRWLMTVAQRNQLCSRTASTLGNLQLTPLCYCAQVSAEHEPCGNISLSSDPAVSLPPQGTLCNDCVYAFFCGPCSWCQISREIKTRMSPLTFVSRAAWGRQEMKITSLLSTETSPPPSHLSSAPSVVSCYFGRRHVFTSLSGWWGAANEGH